MIFGPPVVVQSPLAGFLTDFGRRKSLLGRSLELLCLVSPFSIQVGCVVDLDIVFSYPGLVVFLSALLVFQALLLACCYLDQLHFFTKLC